MSIANYTDRELALQARVKELEAIEEQLSANVIWQAGEIAKHLGTIKASRKQVAVAYIQDSGNGNLWWYQSEDTDVPLFAAPVVAPDVLKEKYDELIYAVHRKFPNETRHETALRYIKRMEEPATTSTAKAMGGEND